MDSKQASQVTTGLLIITVGLVLLGGQLNMGLNVGKLWPMVFVVLGAGQFVSRPSWEGVKNGLWFWFLAAIFLLNNYRIVGLGDTWPLFIVAAGLGVLFGRKESGPADKRVQS